MRRFSRTLAVLGLLASLLLSMGCQPVFFLRVALADLESASVEGIQVYRLDDATGALVQAGNYQFTGIIDEQGEEVMTFDLTTANGQVFPGSGSWLERDPQDANLVTLSLWYPIELEAGWYRVAAFNAAGESAPSLEQTFF